MTDTDLDDAIARLSSAIQNEEDRKIVFLTGSGISMPEVPSTEQMIEIIYAEIDSKDTTKTRRTWSGGKSVSMQYQEAALLLKQRVGQRGLDAAIRKGVLKALIDESDPEISKTGIVEDKAWKIPLAQDLLGELIANIPTQQMGAVITTNFDPLTEVSLRKHSVHATTIAVPGTSAFPVEAVYGTLPVVHLHGFWDIPATLSTTVQLAVERPRIEKMISRLMDRSVVVVLGYGGWEDSFTRALTTMLQDGQMTSLETEMLWFEHGGSDSIASHPFLTKVVGLAGVSVYTGIDAVDVLGGVIKAVGTVNRDNKEPYLGWAYVPPKLQKPDSSSLVGYVDGAQPTWEIAKSVPVFHGTEGAYQRIVEICNAVSGGVIVLAAPAGEGKSTALRQIAIRASEEYPLATVIYRNVGAPRITPDWVAHLRKENDLTVVIVDDADLVLEQIKASHSSSADVPTGKVVWVLGIHSSYLHVGYTSRSLSSLHAEIIEFDNFDSSDAQKLARSWLDNSLLPRKFKGESPNSIARTIIESGVSSYGNSLFGSVLSIWNGEELLDRVGELLTRVARSSISGVSFKHLLSAVAVIQVAWDLQENKGRGMTLSVLGEMARITDADVLRMVVEPLGREVGISRVGNRVYVRHPSIARAIYDLLENRGELDDVVKDIAYWGSVMRFSGKYKRSDYHEAYMLSKMLPGPQAIIASVGAISGGSDRLEPRVSLTASLRNNGDMKKAQEYAAKLSRRLSEYSDSLQVARGLFVEWSVVEARLANYKRAIELSLLSISDQVEGNLDSAKLQYGLLNIAVPARKIAEKGDRRYQALLVATGKALNCFPDPDPRLSRYVNHDDTSSTFEIVNSFQTASRNFAPTRFSFRKMQQVLSESKNFR